MNSIGTSVLHVHLKMVKVFAQIVSRPVMLTIMFPMPDTVVFSVIVGPKERDLATL